MENENQRYRCSLLIDTASTLSRRRVRPKRSLEGGGAASESTLRAMPCFRGTTASRFDQTHGTCVLNPSREVVRCVTLDALPAVGVSTGENPAPQQPRQIDFATMKEKATSDNIMQCNEKKTSATIVTGELHVSLRWLYLSVWSPYHVLGITLMIDSSCLAS